MAVTGNAGKTKHNKKHAECLFCLGLFLCKSENDPAGCGRKQEGEENGLQIIRKEADGTGRWNREHPSADTLCNKTAL